MPTYKGQNYKIVRVKNKNGTYEFWLMIDNKRIISATQLERKGWKWKETKNWETHLKRYGKAYIEGINS